LDGRGQNPKKTTILRSPWAWHLEPQRSRSKCLGQLKKSLISNSLLEIRRVQPRKTSPAAKKESHGEVVVLVPNRGNVSDHVVGGCVDPWPSSDKKGCAHGGRGRRAFQKGEN
jgi:hypothetical protein